MKPVFTFIVCSIGLNVFAQKKISSNELKCFDWLVYNLIVADSNQIFESDTLMLVKFYDLETFDDVQLNDNETVSSYYSNSWNLSFSNYKFGSTVDSNEFHLFYIDLHQAALRKKLTVDSISFVGLRNNPNDFTSESPKIRSVLDNLENGDIIEIISSIHNASFHLEKRNNAFKVLDAQKGRFIHYPKGINSGFWILSKSNQTLEFLSESRDVEYKYRIERIDDIRIRLIRIN